MARVIYTFGELRGSVGGLTFQPNTSGSIVRQRPQCKKSSTTKQQVAHQAHQKYLYDWQQLNNTEKDEWNYYASIHNKDDKYGNSKKLTGANWFESVNYMRTLLSLSNFTSPPTFAAAEPVPAFTLAVSSSILGISIRGSYTYAETALIGFTSLPTQRSTNSINRLRKSMGLVDAATGESLVLNDIWEPATGLTWSPVTNFPNTNIIIGIQTVNRSNGITSPLTYLTVRTVLS